MKILGHFIGLLHFCQNWKTCQGWLIFVHCAWHLPVTDKQRPSALQKIQVPVLTVPTPSICITFCLAIHNPYLTCPCRDTHTAILFLQGSPSLAKCLLSFIPVARTQANSFFPASAFLHLFLLNYCSYTHCCGDINNTDFNSGFSYLIPDSRLLELKTLEHLS